MTGRLPRFGLKKCELNNWGEDYEIKFRANDPMEFNHQHREGCGTFIDMANNVFCYAVGATPSTPSDELPKSFKDLIQLAKEQS